MEVTVFDTPCLNFNCHNCEVYFLRHSLSEANKGNMQQIDTPLSPEGIEQSKIIEGHFDLIFCSPLRRAKETLHWSQITYENLIIEYDIREMRQNKTSGLLLEEYIQESNENFFKRAGNFTVTLEKYCNKLSNQQPKIKPKILIISHGFFFNGWYRNGCFPTPQNGKYFRIK